MSLETHRVGTGVGNLRDLEAEEHFRDPIKAATFIHSFGNGDLSNYHKQKALM